MGMVRGLRSNPRCKKCGEPIQFMPRSGFIRAGEPKYFPVNADDRKPHWKRCRIRQDLSEARRPKSRGPKGLPSDKQGSLTPAGGEKLRTERPVQGDLLDAIKTRT
jgi:hypothetical protein